MKEFNEHGEPIEAPKKKKFNLFSGYNKDGKEIKKEDVIKNYDFFTFFKLYGRRFIKLIWVNALYIMGNFPIFFMLLALSGLSAISALRRPARFSLSSTVSTLLRVNFLPRLRLCLVFTVSCLPFMPIRW